MTTRRLESELEHPAQLLQRLGAGPLQRWWKRVGLPLLLVSFLLGLCSTYGNLSSRGMPLYKLGSQALQHNFVAIAPWLDIQLQAVLLLCWFLAVQRLRQALPSALELGTLPRGTLTPANFLRLALAQGKWVVCTEFLFSLLRSAASGWLLLVLRSGSSGVSISPVLFAALACQEALVAVTQVLLSGALLCFFFSLRPHSAWVWPAFAVLPLAMQALNSISLSVSVKFPPPWVWLAGPLLGLALSALAVFTCISAPDWLNRVVLGCWALCLSTENAFFFLATALSTAPVWLRNAGGMLFSCGAWGYALIPEFVSGTTEVQGHEGLGAVLHFRFFSEWTQAIPLWATFPLLLLRVLLLWLLYRLLLWLAQWAGAGRRGALAQEAN